VESILIVQKNGDEKDGIQRRLNRLERLNKEIKQATDKLQLLPSTVSQDNPNTGSMELF